MVDFHQYGEISRAQRAASSAQSKVGGIQEELSRIHQKIDRLKLVSQAMWEMIRDNTSISEEDVFNKVKEIDARDGKLDGRAGSPTGSCSNCGKVVQKGQEKCQYCGTAVSFRSVFDWVR